MELEGLFTLQADAYLDIYYYDESSFSMSSALPYAWQKKGGTIGVPASKGKRLSVAGLINKDGDFHHICQECNVDSRTVINLMDVFCEQIKQKTVVVLDNAPTHRSKAFMEKVLDWQQKDLYIFFLPPYSPHLNKIEMLWRKIKYQWLDFKAYISWGNMQECLKEVLDNISKKYIFNFG